MAGRMDAQARADRVRAFQEELAELESELGGVLDDAQRLRITQHHDHLLATLADQYDVSTTTSDRQLALGLRFASFLGALAICIAVVLFVERFWGGLTTGVQVLLLAAATVAALGLTEFSARREKTLYFAGLAAMVAFAAFVTDVATLLQIYNVALSPWAFLVWAVFAGALAYGYGLRVLLIAMLVTLAVWIGGVSATLLGFYWLDLFGWSELFLPTAAIAVILGVTPHRGIREQFCSLYRLFGLILLFWVVIWMAISGSGSLMPLANGTVEAIYQVFGFVMAGLTIWYGIREGWNEVTNGGVAAFTILLYVKATDWWWDWMPHWLFFLALGGIAVGVMLLLKRIKTGIGRAT